MWTDGRYYIAAVKQLDQGWTMEKMEAGVKQWPEWILEKFADGATLGFDFTQALAANLETRTRTMEAANINVKSVPNLVDECWGADRPSRPMNEVKHLALEFTGEETLSKYERVAKKMNGKVDSLLVTTLDDICWMTNLRGADIDYNPVFFSYLMIHFGEQVTATLYIDAPKVANLTDYLAANRITVVPYAQIDEDLIKMDKESKRIGVVTSTCNAELHRLVKSSCVV